MCKVPILIPEVTTNITQTCQVENTGNTGLNSKSQFLLYHTKVHKYPRPAGLCPYALCKIQSVGTPSEWSKQGQYYMHKS